MSQATTASTLAKALLSGRRVVTAEFVASGCPDADAVRALASSFPASLDALVVSSDGAQAISSVISSTLLAAQGPEPVLTLSTRDRNRTALLADVAGAAALGVKNVICLPGDHQSLGSQPEAAGVFDVDPIQLVQLLSERQGEGHLSLFIGAEAYPQLRPLDLSLIDVRKKVKAGAGFLLTRPVFDVASFEEWLDAVRREGLDEKTPVIAAVQPLTGVDHAEALRRRLRIPDEVTARLREASDPATEGIALCAETAQRLVRLEGLCGIHIGWSGTPATVAAVISRAGLDKTATV